MRQSRSGYFVLPCPRLALPSQQRKRNAAGGRKICFVLECLGLIETVERLMRPGFRVICATTRMTTIPQFTKYCVPIQL
jgi:hypothetical protein